MIIEKTLKGQIIYFDEDKHRFWREVNGKRKPIKSVTSFTGIIDKSPQLIGWAVKLFKNYLLSKLDNGEQIIQVDVMEGSRQHTIKKQEAADLGTQVHAWVEGWIKNVQQEIPTDNEKMQSCILAFLNFQKKHGFKYLESERIIYSTKHDYAGILDAVAQTTDGKKVLIDFKSSNGIYNEMAFQAAGYQLAYEEETGEEIDYRMIVRFGKEDGSFEFQRFDENDKDKAAFLACLTLKNRISEMEKEQL